MSSHRLLPARIGGLLTGALLTMMLFGASAARSEPVGSSLQKSASATQLYVALHLQQYTGMCGDVYAASGARRHASVCLYGEPVPDRKADRRRGSATAVASSQGAP